MTETVSRKALKFAIRNTPTGMLVLNEGKPSDIPMDMIASLEADGIIAKSGHRSATEAEVKGTTAGVASNASNSTATGAKASGDKSIGGTVGSDASAPPA